MTTKRLDVSPPGFADDDSAPASNLSSMQRAIVTIQKMRAKIEALERTRTEPIAIIGMACRIPGGANTPEAFFQLLEDGLDAVTEVPPERWRTEPEGPNSEGDARALRWGAFLKDVDRFDAAFFGISPREAESLDPQHRLLLEVTWEALERAGQLPERLVGTKSGVFVGIWAPDYQQRVLARDPNDLDAYCFTGTVLSTAAGRLSYTLGLQGPCMSIDTACSSSLTAIHLACQSLRSGESTLAIAGGVNLMLAPTTTKLLSKTQALSPDGRCRTFDARANGYVRGEGCGMLVLKRLSDAERDGDAILALIRGSAVNQDGKSTGLTAPNVLSQQALLRQALESARLTPQDISYLETHGTGTSLGDPIEVEAIKEVLGAPRERNATCILGAVKSNIGHLEAAAGVAGLIKVVLAMQHDKIPGNLHFHSLNPRIDLRGTSLEIAQTANAWAPGIRPRYAGVSSFGISGTNAHVIVEEAPRNLEESLVEEETPTCLLPISAKTPAALDDLVRAYHKMLTSEQGPRLMDIVHTASARRSHYVHRLSAVGRTKTEVAEQLEAYLQKNAPSGVARGMSTPARAKVVFVFSGQGSQWLGMGRQLYETDSSFRSVIDTCDNLMTSRLGWSLLDELDAPEAMSRVNETQVAQPLLFALQVALVEMLRSWGISPDAMIGHSVGEIAAAHIAGILSLDEAIRLVALRGRIMQKATGMGKMVSIAMSPEDAEIMIAGYEDRVSVAAVNDPGSVVLSGQMSALDDIMLRCEKRGFASRSLRVDYAFHSPQMDSFERELVERLVRVDTRRATLAMYSTVLADCVDGKELDVRYWGRNVRQTVNFAGAVFAAIRDGYQLFLEVGPHPVLTGNIQQCLAAKKSDGVAMYTMRRNQDQRRTLLEAIGALYTRGCSPEWTRVIPSGGKCVPLPTYPWQKERYWVEAILPNPSAASRSMALAGPTLHPLLGSAFSLATKPAAHAWQQTLGISTVPWIADHVVQNECVFPGAGYVEMALAAASNTLGRRAVIIEDLVFERMLALPKGNEPIVQVVLDTGEDRQAFHVASRAPDVSSWLTHARGRIASVPSDTPLHIEPIDVIRSRCTEGQSTSNLYTRLEARGLQYGECFRGVEQLWLGKNEAIARVGWKCPHDTEYILHPAQLDACFQVAAYLGAVSMPDGPILPIRISRFLWRNTSSTKLWVHARVSPMQTNEGELCVDFVIMSEEEEVIAKGDAFVLRRVDPQPTSSQDSLAGCAFELAWREKQLPSTSQTSTPHGSWLIVADSMGVGDAMAMRLRAEGWNCTVAVPSDHFEVVESQLYHFNPQIPGDFSRLTKEAFDKTLGCAGAIHLLGLDAEPFEQTTTATLLRDERHVVTTAISLAQALTNLGLRTSPKLVLVTRGACDTGDDGGTVSVIQSSLWGLGRTISLEHPALECTCIDLPRRTFPEEIERLTTELLHSDGEDQIALRATGRYVARIARANVDNAPAEEFVAPEHINGRRFRLGTTKPGILDRLALFETQRQTLDAHHVEIEVEAAGLNFLDVLLAMGILPDDTPGSGATDLRLGLECAGRIVALGEGVTDLRVGQEVIALGLGSMASHVVTTRHLVAAKPEGLEWEDAATLPIVFLTAYLSLAHVAHLGRGERVLIHAGTGGVGMAAIQWAKHVGAEVFATAGSESKRDLLRSLGVHHVMDSRSLSFVDDIRRITHGEGVDVVLNSLSGEFIPASFGLLRDYGRFIEIGKRDYYEDRSIGLKPFLKNLSYTLVDVRGMMLKRPERIASLFAEILALFRTGVFKPLPHQVYGASRAADAFTRMAQARHTGKIAIAMRDPEALLVPQSHSQSAAIRNDGTYLITGGLGGLGLSLAQWMVHQGARNLALVGRSAPSETTQKAIEDMRAEGAFICTVRADVSQMEGTRAVLEQIQSMPPLRGVVHAAAALDDHTLLELEPDHVERVFAPKARGAWNLHEATKHSSLDFFVMYSSATALLGSPGQANYAAANAFLDAFAIARRAIGLPAQSIQWGPFSNVGMAARAERRGARLARHGLDSLSPDEGSLAFARILGGAPAALCVMHFSVRQWLESYPQAAASPYFSELRKESAKPPTSATGTMREELERMAPGQRFEHLERHVLQQLGRVIRLDVARIDARASFTSLGIDSLMSLELRNRLESSLGLRLPPTLLFTYANPSALTKHLLDQLLPHDSTPRNPDRHQGASAVAAAEKHLALPEADDELLAAFDASVRDIKTEMSS